MIRQAISCDICGTEKKQTNHWFVAFDQGGELRVGGWSSRNRLRPGSKHLCGQTCLHKLVDDFMAKILAAKVQTIPEEADAENGIEDLPRLKMSKDATSQPVHAPAMPTALVPNRAELRVPIEVTALPEPVLHVPTSDGASDEADISASRNWRAEAWERERARELRAVERRPDIAARRRART